MNIQLTSDLPNDEISTINKNLDPTSSHFDYIFIGLGASNCLIILSMANNNLFSNKKVAVIDVNDKSCNDKTFCFWTNKVSSMQEELNHIISYQYQQAKIDDNIEQNISSQPYYCIKSIDLYNEALKTVNQYNIPFILTTVTQIEDGGSYGKLITNNGSFTGNQIFDSRPPILNLKKEGDVFLLQSFYGLHIKLTEKTIPVDTFKMMNFDVEQNEYTQFMYTLPYADNEALVEFTRFGVDKMEIEYGKKILDQYIQRNYGNYTVIAEETGAIPMTSILVEKSSIRSVLHTGARANLIKPSTGYGFKNMYFFAQLITDNLKNNLNNKLHLIDLKRKFRFKLYDHLLLIILLKWPHLGKPIFQSLFKNQSVEQVFLFLDEKTSLYDEVKIFAKLPILPFVKALFIYMSKFLFNNQLITILICIVYLTLQHLLPHYAMYFGNTFLIIGLLLIGLPHGAVDHLLINKNGLHLSKFIITYLSVVLVYFCFWQFFPLLSICLFILYSAFHFGESEIEELKLSLSNNIRFISSFLIGLTILLFIIVSHLTESVAVIAKINGLQFFGQYSDLLLIYKLPIMFATVSVFFLVNYLFRNYKSIFLFAILLLGIYMPLLLSFGAYFIGQHSAVAWKHITSKLAISNLSLFKSALPFTIGAVFIFIFLLIFTYYKQFTIFDQFKSQFFIFIACISFPHILLMHTFYKKKYTY